jgi:epoxyqueuosine reductase
MKRIIRQQALELGFDECRFTSALPPESAPHFQQWLANGRHGEMVYLSRNAHKRIRPESVLAQAKTVITLASSYFRRNESGGSSARSGQDSSAGPRGVIARYAQFTDYHDILGARLKTLAEWLDAIAGPGISSLWYVDTGPLLERDLAQRSGLGFIGKHTNLISRQYGNWFFLAELITTLELEPDPPERNRCGSCTRCLVACPTQAIIAPFQLDARLCISYLTIELKGSIPLELRPAVGTRIYGCDDCLEVCPWNRFAREGRLLRDHVHPGLELPDLIELLRLDEDGFRRRFASTPLMRAKRRGLLRNVCVALGNLGDDRALPTLRQAASDREPLVGEHARWAIERIESRLGGSS